MNQWRLREKGNEQRRSWNVSEAWKRGERDGEEVNREGKKEEKEEVSEV